MGAIEILSRQHREVEEMLEKLKPSEGAEKISLLGRIAESLTMHARLEERHFYPLLRQHGLEQLVARSLEEHAEMRRVVSEILELKRSDPRLDQAIGRLESVVLRHAREEESQIFPKAREKVDAPALNRAGEEMKRSMGALQNEELIAQADEQPVAP
jgi:hemerythrin superfamily protein